jgi:IS30 family transposase
MCGESPEVVIEATYGWYWAVQLLQDLGAVVHLANPRALNWGDRRVKNDVNDATDLADMLRLHRLAEAWIAPPVERTTRFVMLIALPDGHRADVVADALAHKIVELPEQLRRSLAWDQGKEMASHARFTDETGVPVYFCDPRSPWQRGTNENTNGLLRQYFPKRAPIAHHTQADLDAVAAQLNGRPRHTLGWKTPSQALDEVLR